MAKRHPKSWSRRAALQLLYSAEINDQKIAELLEQKPVVFDNEEQDGAEPDAYAVTLLEGVEAHKEEIDQMGDSSSDNWAVSRMPVMDRAILRLAVFEMLYVGKVSVSVFINEAVDLAKEFGGEDESHRFVNGVLGQVAKNLEAKDEEA